MNENLPYDPDLKEAMLKIQEIMDDYEIGGSIVLASKTNIAFKYSLPKWSIVQFHQFKKGVGFKVRSERKDFDSKEAQDKVNEDTCNLAARLRDLTGEGFMVFKAIFKRLGGYYDISKGIIND